MSRIKSNIVYGDLTGGINNVDTKENLNSSTKKTETPDMVNVEYFQLGGIKTMDGNTKIGSILGGAVVGGWEYTKDDNRYMVIGLDNGEVYIYNPVTNRFDYDAVDPDNGKDYFYKFAHSSNRMSFCNMNNGVVITNGIDDLLFYERGRNTTLNGTVSVTNGSDTVTGSSTTFGTDVIVGDYVRIEGCAGRYKVTSITNATTMKVSPVIDTSYTIHYYNFFNGADNYYCLKAIPEVGDDVYDDNEQVISTITYVQEMTDGECAITFQIGGSDVLGVRRHVPSGSDTFNRDKDVTHTPASLSGKTIKMAEISECNATLVNEDDPSISTPIRGLAIQYYNGRLWVGTDNGLFYSQVGQFNKWDIKYDAGVLYSIYNDTSEIKALGLFSDFLVIHKKFSTYILTCTGDATTIAVKPFSNITCESQQSWIVSNTKYFIYSRDFMDIYPLVQHTVFSDKFLGEPITKKVRDVFKNLRSSDVKNIFCVSRPRQRQMIFYMPMVNQLGSGYALIYDFQTKSFLVRIVPQEVTCAFNYDNNIYIGTKDGLVLREFAGRSFQMLNSDGTDVVDTAIISYYKSPWFDWANGYTHSFAEFMIEIANDYNNDFIIRTQKDGQSRFEDRNITSDALVGDALIWDGVTDLDDNNTFWDEDNWVRGTFENIRMLLPNNVFEDFQIEIRTDELYQSFAIYQYSFRRIETEEAPW